METPSIKTGMLSSTLLGDPKYSSNNIVFASDKGNITLCPLTGKVTFPEGMTVDEASKRFWDGFVQSFGGVPTQDRLFTVLSDYGDSTSIDAVFTKEADAKEYAAQTDSRYLSSFVSWVRFNPPFPLPVGMRKYIVSMEDGEITKVEAGGSEVDSVPYFSSEWDGENAIYDGMAEIFVGATSEEEAKDLAIKQRDELIKAGKWRNKGDKWDCE